MFEFVPFKEEVTETGIPAFLQALVYSVRGEISGRTYLEHSEKV